MTVGRAEVTRGPTSLAEMARLSGEFADRHNLVYCVLWLTGELDLAAVREAWRGVCLSHDVLRRAYVSPDEACTYEDVLGEVEFYTADTDTEALKTVRRITIPFDLAGVGLSRIAIVQRDDRRHLLAIVLDHIIVDEKTWKRLMADFGEFYERATQGASVPDKAEKNAYHDFTLLERRELSTAWGEERRAFWRSQTEQFGTFPPAFPIACEAKGESRLTAVHHALPADAKASTRHRKTCPGDIVRNGGLRCAGRFARGERRPDRGGHHPFPRARSAGYSRYRWPVRPDGPPAADRAVATSAGNGSRTLFSYPRRVRVHPPASVRRKALE